MRVLLGDHEVLYYESIVENHEFPWYQPRLQRVTLLESTPILGVASLHKLLLV